MKSLILQICTYISMLLKEYVHITAFLSLLNVNEIQKGGGVRNVYSHSDTKHIYVELKVAFLD